MKQFWTTLAVLLILGSQTSFAQLQLRFSTGYNFSASTEPSGSKRTVTAGGETEENIYNSLGAGFTVDLGVGYQLNEYVTAELGVQYLAGSKATFADVSVEIPDYSASVLAEASTQQIRLIPSVIVTAPTEVPVQPYGRFGVVLPVSGQTTTTVTDIENAMGAETVIEQESQTTGQLSVGFLGAFGLSYTVNERLSISLEGQYTGLRIAGNESEVVRLEVNSNDALATLDVYDKETVFVDELTSSSNNEDFNDSYDETQPEEALRGSNNFNALGVQVGVRFKF